MKTNTKRHTNIWVSRVGIENLSLIVTLILMALLISSQSPYFFTARNLINIGMNMSVVGLVAVGMTMVIAAGGLDISVGSIAGVASVVCAMSFVQTESLVLATAGAILVGAVLGGLNAAMINWLNINPVVATLATFSAYRGIAFLAAPEGRSISVVSTEFSMIGMGRVGETETFPGIPIALLLLLAVALCAYLVMQRTVFGRSIYAMGGNSAAAKLCGIDLNSMKFWLYAISGALAGLAGLVVTSRTSSGQPTSGTQGLELEAITSVFLGGALLSGGKGSIVGTLLAVLLIATLSNGMNLLGIPAFFQLVAKGFLLIIAVAISQWRLAHKS